QSSCTGTRSSVRAKHPAIKLFGALYSPSVVNLKSSYVETLTSRHHGCSGGKTASLCAQYSSTLDQRSRCNCSMSITVLSSSQPPSALQVHSSTLLSVLVYAGTISLGQQFLMSLIMKTTG